MIDNLELIKPLLDFPTEDTYYFLQILRRKKDNKEASFEGGSNNSSRLIRPYFVNNIEYLDNHYEEIKALCQMFNARAGINLNRRSYKSSSLKMLSQLARNIECGNERNMYIWNTVAGEYHPIKDKVWILDVDDVGRELNDIILFAERECKPDGNKFITRIPSKAGCHIIMKPFDLSVFGKKFPEIEIHKNNPTNLYIP